MFDRIYLGDRAIKKIEFDLWSKQIRIQVNLISRIAYGTTEWIFYDNEDLEDVNILDFIKENVNIEVTDEDVKFYSDVLDDLIVEIDNNSKLLEEHNRPSLIALIAYACENEVDDILKDWIKYYFDENKTYMANQKENYTYMVKHINIYQNMMERVS